MLKRIPLNDCCPGMLVFLVEDEGSYVLKILEEPIAEEGTITCKAYKVIQEKEIDLYECHGFEFTELELYLLEEPKKGDLE